jgi:hypothetical protein
MFPDLSRTANLPDVEEFIILRLSRTDIHAAKLVCRTWSRRITEVQSKPRGERTIFANLHI